MTPTRSQLRSEVHSHWHSTITTEPPTSAPSSTSDEGALTQRGTEKWGNEMGEKQPTTLRVVFQNIGGFLTEEEKGGQTRGITQIRHGSRGRCFWVYQGQQVLGSFTRLTMTTDLDEGLVGKLTLEPLI